MIQIDDFPSKAIRHAYYGRRGGVSGGNYTSLNCGFGSADSASNVTANRARAMAALDLDASSLFTCHQIHSTTVVTLDSHPGETEIRADAMVTSTPGLALGILTADCAPLLFADPVDGIIGAAHAGWRGALGEIAAATVDAMIELGARSDNIHAAIGPCIGVQSYEVGPEFPGPFLDQAARNAVFFAAAARSGHFMFDLGGYLAAQMDRLGLAAVHRLDFDTCSDEANFFSYRRSVLTGKADYGRALAVIALAPPFDHS
ncbi:MAG: peptidoglycan editing factor PgeF [Rhodospirillaceae bacterium]